MSSQTDSAPVESPERFEAEWRTWRQERIRRLTDPHGFLAVTGLFWLTDEPTRIAGAPGLWWTERDTVAVKLDDGEELALHGTPITGVHSFGTLAERTGLTFASGESVVEVAKRGGKYIVRPRHPQNALLQDFRGVPSYHPDPRWSVQGTFRPFERPRATTVGAAVEGIQHVYEAPGEIEFSVAGQDYRLTAFNGQQPGSLLVLFTDATSGKTTYAANRSLAVWAPGPDGAVVLDFNRATNLPCAFTDLATCPLPPAENRLPIAIEAGEKIPYERR